MLKVSFFKKSIENKIGKCYNRSHLRYLHTVNSQYIFN